MIRSNQAHLIAHAATHPGMKGKNNEDRYAVSAFRMEDEQQTPVLLALLSDGIGGHRAGEVAAEMAVNLISQAIADSDGNQPVRILQQAVQVASSQIHESSLGEKGREGMGATCACALVIGNRLYTTNIGDSRIYLIRNNHIRQLSTDHTWLQEALDAGLLKPEQVEGHPNAHIIRRYLGSARPVQADFRLHLNPKETNIQSEANQGMLLLKGDLLLLCSDGLTDLVKNDELLHILKKQPPEESSKTLIDLANQRGGHDNITMIIVQVPNKGNQKSSPLRYMTWIVICGLLLILLMAGLFYGWIWYSSKIQPTPTPLRATTEPVPSSSPRPVFPTETGMPIETAVLPTLKPREWVFPSITNTLPVFQWEEGTSTLTPWPTSTSQVASTPTPTETKKPSREKSPSPPP